MSLAKYQMQAQDSVSLSLRTWLSDLPDYAGASWVSISGSTPIDPVVAGGGFDIVDTVAPDGTLVFDDGSFAVFDDGSFAVLDYTYFAFDDASIAALDDGSQLVAA